MGELGHLQVDNSLQGNATMRAATLVLENEGLGVANRVKMLPDDSESVFNTHVRKKFVVDVRQVHVEKIQVGVDYGKQLLDALSIKERHAVQVPTLNKTLFLKSGVGKPDVSTQSEALSQFLPRNVKLREV